MSPLRFRGNDIIVFHVLDPTELEFGFSDAQPFEDLESGEQMPVVPEAFREEYRSLVTAHIDALTRSFAGVRVDYTMLDTSKPLDFALYRYLGSRAKMMKSAVDDVSFSPPSSSPPSRGWPFPCCCT